jgi:hypothetical protein
MFKTTYYVAVQNHLPSNGISSKAEFTYRTSNGAQKLIATTLSKLELFHRVNSRSNSFRCDENFNAVWSRGSEDICSIAFLRYVTYHHLFREIHVNYT